MQPFSRAIAPLPPKPTIPTAPTAQAITVSRMDRWSIYYRLQDLMIACWCLEDGSLWVEVKDAKTALLVHSVVRQFIASRRELVNWLDRCWEASE